MLWQRAILTAGQYDNVMSGMLRGYCTYTAVLDYEMPAMVYEPLDYCRHEISVTQEFNKVNGQVIQELNGQGIQELNGQGIQELNGQGIQELSKSKM